MTNHSGVQRRTGVCSWSLQPSSARDLARLVTETGLPSVQLALDPVRTGSTPADELETSLRSSGIAVLSGMMAMAGEDYSTLRSIRETGGIVPDETWESNLESAQENARLARRFGIRLVTFHAGFVPHDAHEPRRAVMAERLEKLATTFADEGIDIALETGQEDAGTMLSLVQSLQRYRVGINFDPANMILYGMGDPVSALETLAPFVRQVHIKDAQASNVPGEWGTEVAVGEGDVDWPAFFRVLDAHRLNVDLVIEREAGNQRVADIRSAAALVRRESGNRDE